ncbi:hypothetical protein VPNG_02377 [Cytospora leucostoma]|uniref:Rhodopsin domain-containing protein n=1 Tax=Cytospora leucostoma TaxID=1230097 RepID=A0A423XH13_9PEZI|nr:hypothetical protein VPNG_02377 [Cytospora leucostoma]
MALALDTNILIIAVVFSTAALFAVCLRFYARTRQHAILGIDDFLMVPAAACAIGVGVANAIAVRSGHLGRHIQMGPDGPIYGEFLVTLLKCEFASELLSIASLACAKASIVCFYRRIFRGKRFSTVSLILLILIALWGIAFFFGQLFDCSPIKANWDVFGETTSSYKCINPLPMYYSVAVLDTFIDLLILAVPQPLVWKLQMPMRRKIAVSLVFLLGAFTIGISAARIGFFVQVGRSEDVDPDIPFFIAPTIYWTQLECAIAVICGCLPTLPVLFSEVSPERVLRSWVSKFSLRSAPTRSKDSRSQDDTMPQWQSTPSVRAGSASSILGNKTYTWDAVPLTSIEMTRDQPLPSGNAILVHKAVLQKSTGGAG